MAELDFTTLIINWHKRKVVQGDYFAKFIFEYLAFIAYLKRVRHLDGRDREIIQQFKRDTKVKSVYGSIMSDSPALQRTLRRLVEELNEEKLVNVNAPSEMYRYWNNSNPYPHNRTDNPNPYPLGVINDENDWCNLIEFWYTVRNNLFHGDKDPGSGRDILIAEYAYKTIRPLVAYFITLIPTTEHKKQM